MTQKKSPLETAVQNGSQKLTEREAKGALDKAVGRISSLTKKADASKDALVATGSRIVHTAETQGSLFLSSMAEGYLGEDKLKVGGVDLRAPVGLLSQGYGLFQTLSGAQGGDHALSIGNGVFGSWLASVGQHAGRTLAEKRGVTTPPSGPLPAPPQGPTLQGPLVQVPALPAPALPAPYYGAENLAGRYVAANTMPGYPHGQAAQYPVAHPAPRVNLIPEPRVQLQGSTREVLFTPHAEPPTESYIEPQTEGVPRGGTVADAASVAGPARRQRRQTMVRAAATNRFPRANVEDETSEEEDTE